MQPNELLRQDNVVTLNNGQVSSISLGKLPPDTYFYRFSIVNPSGLPGKLTITAKGKDWITPAQDILFKDSLTEYQYSFKTSASFDYGYVHFVADSKENIWLHLPVSPIMKNNTEERSALLLDVGEKLMSRLNDIEPVKRHANGQLPSFRSASQKLNSDNLQALMEAKYFRGFLSLEESEKQLDYVIFQKLFKPDGSGGFSGFKRKIYRKFLTGLYRLLIRNRHRKLYFAKLYGNYVNMGTLAENIRK